MSQIEWRPWLLLSVFSLVGFLITASTFSSLGVVLPDMIKEEHWGWGEAGIGFTILGASCGFSSFIPMVLIRRFGVRFTLILGTTVMVGGFACLSQTNGLPLYFLGTALCGVGYQMMALIPATHVMAIVFKHRAMPFGFYFTISALGGVAGPLMVLKVLDVFHDQWRVYWIIQMFAAIAVGLVCALCVGGPAWLAAQSEVTDHDVAEELTSAAPGPVYRTAANWTVAEAVRTPQFYVLLAAYFGHLLVGVSVASMSVGHLTERGVAFAVAGQMLALESLVQTGGRALGGLLGDLIEPRYLLVFALFCLTIGSAALSVAHDTTTMLIYAVGSGLGFGLTALAVTVLVLNYFGRKHNLEIFSLTCLIGGVSALGPTIGGFIRDGAGSFAPAFQIYAGVIAVIFVAATFMRPPRRVGETPGAAANITEFYEEAA
jgi:MFS family permease